MSQQLVRTWRDMALSIGVVVGVIAVVYLFTFRPGTDEPKAIDYQSTLVAARSSGRFPVAASVGHPDWVATSVRYRPSPVDPKIATWHLGYLTPDQQYAAIEQSNANDPDFISQATTDGRAAGTFKIDGLDWTMYKSTTSDTYSLVSKTGEVTTVVTGTLNYDQLAEFAKTLRTS